MHARQSKNSKKFRERQNRKPICEDINKNKPKIGLLKSIIINLLIIHSKKDYKNWQAQSMFQSATRKITMLWLK